MIPNNLKEVLDHHCQEARKHREAYDNLTTNPDAVGESSLHKMWFEYHEGRLSILGAYLNAKAENENYDDRRRPKKRKRRPFEPGVEKGWAG